MQPLGRSLRLLAFAALVASMGAFAASPASAETDGGTLTIHSRVCPLDGEFDDFFEDCHDTPAGELEFIISGPSGDLAGNADASGNISFTDLLSGEYNVQGGVPGEFAQTYAYCSTADGAVPGTLIEVEPGVGVNTTVLAGTETVCDWYAVPFDLRGDSDSEPTTVPVDDGGDDDGGITTLPNTGSGADVSSTTVAGLAALLLAALGAAGASIAVQRRRA